MATTEPSTDTSKTGITFNHLGDASSSFALILIHGWGCQRADYDGVLEYFSNKSSNLRIVVPELPGHGSTSKDVCPTPSITGFAEVLIALVKEVGVREVVLVGHSMGVRIVSEIWRLCQQSNLDLDIRGIVFIDGSDYRTRPTIAFDKGDLRSKDITSEQVAALKTKVFQAMFSPKTPEAFRRSTVEHVASCDKAYSETLRDSMIAYDKEWMSSTMEALGKAGNPMLLNVQSSDTGGPTGERRPMKAGEVSKWMRYLEETVPQSRQFVVENSAHFAHVDWPEVVGEKIWELVEEVRSK